MSVNLIHDDCMEAMRAMPDNSVDLIATDPPYGVDYQSAARKGNRLPKIANDKQPFIWWLHDAARVLKDGGAMLCFCRWDTSRAFSDAIVWSGLKLRSEIVWDRCVHGMADVKTCAAPQHDTILFAAKGRHVFAGKRPKSVIREQRLSGDALTHPNEKPVGLMENIVAHYSKPGDTVLDCFMGSGTTGIACQNLGRDFIGIELDDKYFALASERISGAPLLQGVAV